MAYSFNELKIEIDRLRAELAQVREILSDREARIAELEAAGNRLGDAAITGILDGNDALARAEAELDISREALRMVQSALLSQAAETERVEAERDALREALRKIEQETIDHVAVRIARAALAAPSPAGPDGRNLAALLREALEDMIAVAEGRFDGNPHADIDALAKACAALNPERSDDVHQSNSDA